MNPMSIVTNPWGILQVVDRLASLVSQLEDLANASEDLAYLQHEISSLIIVLDRVLSLASNKEQLSVLRDSVMSSLTTVARLQALVGDTSISNGGRRRRRGKAALDSLVWLRKKRRVETIKQQLRDHISTVQLELVSLSLRSQYKISASLSRFGTTIEAAEATFGATCSRSPESTRKIGPVPAHVEFQSSGFSNKVTAGPASGPIQLWNEQHNLDAAPPLASELGVHDKRSPEYTNQSIWISWLPGFFYFVILECYHRSVLRSKTSRSGFRRNLLGITSASISFSTTWNPAKPIFRIAYSSLPSPSLSLSFPRILPPDSDIFIYIRAGRIEEVKSLLSQGRASILDIAAPYGLSTVSLAQSCKQVDIYNFLVAAGGKCHFTCSDTTGADQLDFWMNFASQDYKMSATDILRDEIQQTASMTGVSGCNGGAPYYGDYESLTRLHKCVLGLTTEKLHDILPQLHCLDEADSFGHTALHLGAYGNDTDTVALLLTWGADPELQDNTCKTALHISAAHDSAACTRILASSGVNVHAKDRLGNTSLHHACKLGYLRVIEVLLEHGADIQDCNYFGETALTYANLGGHLAAVQLLQKHNADLTHRDKLGTTVVHDAIWFNSHDALQFYLKNSMRVDQKLQNGKSTLHLLAEEGDATTMKNFLEFACIGIEDMKVDDKDDRGYTAMQYLKFRRDFDEIMPLFQRVLERVNRARFDSGSKNHQDIFWDAMEVQQ